MNLTLGSTSPDPILQIKDQALLSAETCHRTHKAQQRETTVDQSCHLCNLSSNHFLLLFPDYPPNSINVYSKLQEACFLYCISSPKDMMTTFTTDSQIKTLKHQCFSQTLLPSPNVSHTAGGPWIPAVHSRCSCLILTEPLPLSEESWFGHDHFVVTCYLSHCPAFSTPGLVPPLFQRLSLPTSTQLPARLPFPSLRKECRQGKLSDFLHEYFSS